MASRSQLTGSFFSWSDVELMKQVALFIEFCFRLQLESFAKQNSIEPTFGESSAVLPCQHLALPKVAVFKSKKTVPSLTKFCSTLSNGVTCRSSTRILVSVDPSCPDVVRSIDTAIKCLRDIHGSSIACTSSTHSSVQRGPTSLTVEFGDPDSSEVAVVVSTVMRKDAVASPSMLLPDGTVVYGYRAVVALLGELAGCNLATSEFDYWLDWCAAFTVRTTQKARQAALGDLNKRLQDTKYICGDGPCLVDLLMHGIISGSTLKQTPNVTRWYSELTD